MTSTIKYPLLVIASAILALASTTERVIAQSGLITTFAGGGTSMAEGVPALNTSIYSASGIGMDAAGNFYYMDMNQFLLKKVDASTGLVHTIAGIYASPGYSGDGGPATSAQLGPTVFDIAVTQAGDVYIADNPRIRKISATTGIITTIPTIGLTGRRLFLDSAENIYAVTASGFTRVDAITGAATVISSSAYGDGNSDFCMDNAGNIYMNDAGTVWKWNAATGTSSVVAGGSSASSYSDGIPATTARFNNITSIGVDGIGNLFIADRGRWVIRWVQVSTGIIHTIAGNTYEGVTPEGAPAAAAPINPYMLLVHPSSGEVFYSDKVDRIRKFSYLPMVPLSGWGSGPGVYISDSFRVNLQNRCSGPGITVHTTNYHSGMTLRTDFGDGSIDTSAIAASWSGSDGFLLLHHVFPSSGTYSIKHVLCNAGLPIDSLTYSYEYRFCSDLSVHFYYDLDGNCEKDGPDPYLMHEIRTEIDSNGIAIDTLVATSGLNYAAYGTPGDVYRFKVLTTTASVFTSCPASGILYDTLRTGITTNAVQDLGLSFIPGSDLDLDVRAVVPITGTHWQLGHIYLRNNYCTASDAIVGLTFSPKYQFADASYGPTHLSNTINWTIFGVNRLDARPFDLMFRLHYNTSSGILVDGEQVTENIGVISTTGPDVNTTNNVVVRVDTAKASLDPNLIEATPSCYDNDTTFHFTIHFENIGSGPAVNVYIMDTLSPFLDPSTFSIDMTSHPMFITKEVANGKTIFKFDFPDINLADSSDHEHRDGMVMYTIRNRPSLPVGTPVFNRAGIYFDYNDVLMTNTAQITRGCPVPPAEMVNDIAAPSFTLYPNPVSNELAIKTVEGMFSSMTITNAIGQQVLQKEHIKAQTKVNVKDIPAGIYYVTLTGEQGREVMKFVKL